MKRSAFLWILLSLSILTVLSATYLLFNQKPEDAHLTGFAVSQPTIELYEGYSESLDLDNDGVADHTITLNYADKGLANLKVEKIN